MSAALSPELQRARRAAVDGLLSNLRTLRGGSMLSAGAHHYRSVWTRDFCFSAGGLIRAGRPDAARSTTEAILAHQRRDGLFPRLLDNVSPFRRVGLGVLGRDLPLKDPLRPNFTSEAFVEPIDGNALLPWAAQQAAEASQDAGFAAAVLPALRRGLDWYRPRLRGGLVSQPPFSDWKDSLRARRGLVFFTNLLYWRAHLAMAALEEMAGGRPEPWRAEAEALRARVHGFFWDEQAGRYGDVQGSRIHSCDGNLFAILWGFCGGKQAGSILAAMDAEGVWTPWGPRCAVPDYPLRHKGLIPAAAGLADYHDRLVWLWQSGLAVRALAAAGERDRARALALRVGALIEGQGAAGEVVEPFDGRPVVRRLYRSEAPFSWSSAMLVEAFDTVC